MERLITAWVTDSPTQTIYWSIAFSMVFAFAITLIIAQFDERTIDGIQSVWAKPLKFELSLAIHAATLALVVSTLSETHRQGSLMLILASIFLAACLFEIGYIITQAARAEHSHFNVSTQFHRAMYSAMALAAIVIIGAAGSIGLFVAFDTQTSLGLTVRWAIVLGLIGGTIFTLFTAFTIGGRMSPYIGAIPDANGRMLFTGWSLVGGDLRVSHFLSTHMIQVLPLIGILVERIFSGRFAMMVLVMSAIAWSVLIFMEYRTALLGKPTFLTSLMNL